MNIITINKIEVTVGRNKLKTKNPLCGAVEIRISVEGDLYFPLMVGKI